MVSIVSRQSVIRGLAVMTLLVSWPVLAEQSIAVEDDTGSRVSLDRPAQRIISLAPHVTEMLFSAGGGDKVVGVVAHSDYPPAARELPELGTYKQFDFERIVALEPDLLVGWESGNPAALIEHLRALDIPLYLSEPRTLDGIADNVVRLGQLAGTADTARAEAEAFRSRVARLRERYASEKAVTFFYEVWDQPLVTLNGEHLVSRVASMCGGRNVFADLSTISPKISVEAVLAEDPQMIIASGMGDERPEWLNDWKQWSSLRAVKHDQLYFIPPDIIQRNSLRVIEGAERLCEQLEQARQFYVRGDNPD